MAYTPWTVDEMMLANENWVSYRLFRDTLLDIKLRPFNIKAARDDIRTLISELKGVAPFSQTRRFTGNNDLFVHIDNVHLSNALMDLMACIDLPDRLSNVDHQHASHQNMDDRKRNFDFKRAEVIKILSLRGDEMQRYGIYTQGSFEAVFGLTWA